MKSFRSAVAEGTKSAKTYSGSANYYYVSGEQKDGEMVWISPIWSKYE